MTVDETDIRILEHLDDDGRISLRKLADKLGMSPSTVSNRFHTLQEDGVIQGFRPIIDHEQLGFGLTAIIEVKADSSRMQETVDALKANDTIVSLYEVTGATDMVLVCKFLDREDMNDAVKTYQQVEGVRETQTKVVLTSPKEYGRIDLGRVLQGDA